MKPPSVAWCRINLPGPIVSGGLGYLLVARESRSWLKYDNDRCNAVGMAAVQNYSTRVRCNTPSSPRTASKVTSGCAPMADFLPRLLTMSCLGGSRAVSGAPWCRQDCPKIRQRPPAERSGAGAAVRSVRRRPSAESWCHAALSRLSGSQSSGTGTRFPQTGGLAFSFPVCVARSAFLRRR